ncbi:FGGY carbohydrate kinase domain-containing protein-like isoform X2 [Uloborus diversus]|uniref:FGGY carbohydrate kinase domain-containing protein-like isoform X2 n=1 Tax=Uloborus diversus TaxID=327109 RepID=UPI0024091F82|nr:FGGY carbohydrate kinase domain-containing protein-like isoform X2 [Uloborus diversus]
MKPKDGYYIGIDVGTQSVRGGLVRCNGVVEKTASLSIKTWNPTKDVYEQSSDNIWTLCVAVVKEITKNCDPSMIHGIGFDATCSLVAIDKELKPLSVSESGNPEQNIVLWMDHRAVAEANFINSKQHKVLKYVGGIISPEMQPPKLLWLKKHLEDQWAKSGYFFDLPDFLTWKSTGSCQRSLCSLVCKWTYQAGQGSNNGWQDDFWNEIGLSDLVEENYKKIGSDVLIPGEPCGNGLSVEAAKEMKLLPGIPVSASIIDAHAGGLGVLSCSRPDGIVDNIEDRMAVICGTSTCHMKVCKNPIFTSGVWGPYFSAMVPGFWCSEAGQSAAGSLLDHIVSSHPASTHLLTHDIVHSETTRHVSEVMAEQAASLCSKYGWKTESVLATDYHVYPDYHGNRSPLANPDLKGMICGLTLSQDEEDLIKQYLATIQGLAYSTRHIISALESNGHTVKCLLLCGGLAKNKLYVQQHADATGLPVIIPNTPEPVLLGSAILGATAAKHYDSVLAAMSAISQQAFSTSIVTPRTEDKEFHDKKYGAFLKLLKCQMELKQIMKT